MAQITFRGNLSSAAFPFISDFGGRSIVVPQLDENFLPSSVNTTANDSDRDRGIPQLYYCHNVVPVGQGYKSISYTRTVPPVVPAVINFIEVLVVKDVDNNKALLGFTTDGHVYILAASMKEWLEITVTDWTGVGNITMGIANGSTYVCLQGLGVFLVDITGLALVDTALTGLDTALLLGISNSNNYLIAYTTTKVYWCSSLDPLDFVPSEITGAGSGTPNDLDGLIITVVGIINGFITYSTKTVIISTFSGNIRYPWIFRAASFGAGINFPDQVTNEVNLGYHYAWTSAGLLRVTNTGCEVVFPELTDFLSGKIFEDYDITTKKFTRRYLSKQVAVRLGFVGSRFLVISYGIFDEQYSHAIIYDTAFKRWGKIKINHIKCFDLSVSPNGGPLPYTALENTIWTQYIGVPYTALSVMNNAAAEAKENLAFLQDTGTIQTANFSFGQTSADAVLMLGKFQIVRSSLCTLQEVDIEGIEESTNNFNVCVFSTLYGQKLLPPTVPIETIREGKLRRYNSRVSGTNHIFAMHGDFHVTTTVLTLSLGGSR